MITFTVLAGRDPAGNPLAPVEWSFVTVLPHRTSFTT